MLINPARNFTKTRLFMGRINRYIHVVFLLCVGIVHAEATVPGPTGESLMRAWGRELAIAQNEMRKPHPDECKVLLYLDSVGGKVDNNYSYVAGNQQLEREFWRIKKESEALGVAAKKRHFKNTAEICGATGE